MRTEQKEGKSRERKFLNFSPKLTFIIINVEICKYNLVDLFFYFGGVMRTENKNFSGGVIKGTFFLTVSTLIVKLLGVIYKIPLSGYLGDEGMGYFNSAYTVFSFFYIICTAGVPKAVMILTERARAERGEVDSERVVRFALTAFFIFGGVMTAALIIFAPLLSIVIGSRRSVFTIIAVAPSVFFVSVAGVIRGRLTADMRFLSISISQIIEAVGRLVLGLIFAYIGIRRGLSPELVSALTILGVTLGAFFGLLYLYVSYKNSKTEYKIEQKVGFGSYKRKEVLKNIFSISIPITLSAAVMSLTNIIDLGLIMRRLGALGYTEAEAASLYGNYTTLAVSMLNLALALVSPISVAFLPFFSRFHSRGEIGLLSEAVKDSLRLSSIISSPVMLGLMFYSEEVLSLIFKNTSIEIGALLLVILAPAIYLMSSLLTVNSLLEAVGEVKSPMYSMLIGSSLKIVICYFLVSQPYFGIKAAPLGTVISYMAALLTSLYIAEKKRGISLPIIGATLPPLVIAFISVLLSVPLKMALDPLINKDLSTVIIILFVAILYISMTFISGVFNRKSLKKMAKYTNFA